MYFCARIFLKHKVMKNQDNEIVLEGDLMKKASLSLDRMLKMS